MLSIRLDPQTFAAEDLIPAAHWIHAGGIVAFPTDTFYGLAVDPGSASAVRALFDIKGRDAHVAVPLVAASRAQVRAAGVQMSASNERLADAFWPGPLSLVLDAPASVVPAVHGGMGTVAVRVPAHRLARALADACGHWLTATSANLSGRATSATADGLGTLSKDSRLFVLDGGRTPGGGASTIVDARGADVVLVRAGAVDWNRVLESLHG